MTPMARVTVCWGGRWSRIPLLRRWLTLSTTCEAQDLTPAALYMLEIDAQLKNLEWSVEFYPEKAA